jgi:transketolase
MRYLANRGLVQTEGRKVWGFFGDGEMDEPESTAALSLAAREGLDNLLFVINCNLQRLDGPVRSNGRIIDELEAQFIGAGWNVIKVIWARIGTRCSRATAPAHCCAPLRIPSTASSRPSPRTTARTTANASSVRTRSLPRSPRN